jgi:8-oxo-dGTP pyrophosphatase MutT (NUDIX family)
MIGRATYDTASTRFSLVSPPTITISLGATATSAVATLSSCVLIERNGRFATIKSRKHNGQPELLGGKAEPGESPEETAVREAREEGGVEAINLRLVLVASIGGHRCSVFAAEVASGARLRGGAEGEAVWSTREQLLTEGTYRADFPAIVEAYDRVTRSPR